MYVVVCLSSGIDQKAENTEITYGNYYKLMALKRTRQLWKLKDEQLAFN